jgi:hypothetical protein
MESAARLLRLDDPKLYRPRRPERSPFYAVLYQFFDRFTREYEQRFERTFGSSFLREDTGGDALPTAIVSIQTAGEFLNWHPHLHALAPAGSFRGFGLIPIPWWVYRRRKAAGSSGGRCGISGRLIQPPKHDGRIGSQGLPPSPDHPRKKEMPISYLPEGLFAGNEIFVSGCETRLSDFQSQYQTSFSPMA